MVSLSKGQSISLKKAEGGSLTRVIMGLGWDTKEQSSLFGLLKRKRAIDLDASCVVFNDQGVIIDTIWFRQLASKEGAIKHSGDNLSGEGAGDDEQINVDLTKLPSQAVALVFLVSSFSGESFNEVENAYCRLVDAITNQEVARYQLTGSGAHTAQIMAKLSRSGGEWSMTALGEKAQGQTFQDMLPTIRRVL